MIFDLDPKKSEANREKHKVSLQEATLLWSVQAVVIEARTQDEPRFMIIGKLKGKFYSCIFTVRGEAIRLISARRSREKEEAIYYEHIGKEKHKSE